jgi:hypothetical protein
MVRSAECGVQPFKIFLPMPLALASEGQGTWDLTDFYERRIHSAKNSGGRISQCAEKIFRQCRSTALQNYSPLATRHSLPFSIWEFGWKERAKGLVGKVIKHCESERR